MRRPPRAIPDRLVRTWWVIQDGEHTVRSIAHRLGIPVATCHQRLCQLRDLGLIDWDPSKDATIHATYQVVAHGQEPPCPHH